MEKLLKLLEYTFWANDLFIVRVQEQPEIPEGITKQMSHLLQAHRIWLQRINGRGTLPSVWGEVNPGSWEGINIELYNESCDLVKSQEADKRIAFKTSDGDLFEHTFSDIMHHVINHSTHHRAQIAAMMRAHQILPPQSDYVFYLRSV